MAPAEDNDRDSGMESQEGSQSQEPEENGSQKSQSQSQAPPSSTASAASEKKRSAPEIEEGEDDEPDETLSERLWGLTEMFPEPIRNFTWSAVVNTKDGIKFAYSFSRSATWVIFSTSIILFAPIIFEVERAQMEEMQKNQQKQLLLGPNSAISGGVPPPIMPIPQQKS